MKRYTLKNFTLPPPLTIFILLKLLVLLYLKTRKYEHLFDFLSFISQSFLISNNCGVKVSKVGFLGQWVNASVILGDVAKFGGYFFS